MSSEYFYWRNTRTSRNANAPYAAHKYLFLTYSFIPCFLFQLYLNPQLTGFLEITAHSSMRSPILKLFCCLIVLLIAVESRSQSENINGIVLDSATHLPIAFAGITLKGTQRGVLTDIDGRFTLAKVPKSSHLVVNHVGYARKEIALTRDTGLIQIMISRKNDALDEVVVSSNLNPAHRIILLMQERRKQNDPLQLPSYFYNAYSIAALGTGPRLFTMGREMSQRNSEKAATRPKRTQPSKKLSADDSVILRAQRASSFSLFNNYLFVAESYTERKYLFPRRSKETVIASKVSGIKNPIFAVTTWDFHNFSFYLDYVRLLKKTYTTPMLSGSINFYKFNLRQVIPHENDTTWVISYEPKKNRNFDGLRGLLYINSDNYAIENVIASPADEKDMFLTFKLQQKYERLNSGRWFPKQLNAYMAQMDLVKDSALFYWDIRTYLTNIDLTRTFRPSEFSDVTIEIPRDAGKKTEEEWKQFRTDSLPQKEKATYRAYETMPPAFTKTLNSVNTLSEVFALQAIPWGKTDIPFKYLVSGINSYEKLRLGFGLQTNTLLSNWVSAGGYFGYGLGDKAWKYGGNLVFNFNRRTHTELRFSFRQDLQEPGAIPFFTENATLYSNSVLRSLYASRFDSVRQFRVQLNTKLTPNLQADAWVLKEQRNPAAYDYGFDIESKNQFSHSYNITEVGIGLRFSRRETYASFGRALVMSAPPRTRILFQVSRGFKDLLGGEIAYTKMALQVNQLFDTKLLGRTSFQAELGKIWGNIPYAYMFNTRGIRRENRSASGLYVGNSFQTAGVYEFNATQSASLFFQQNFGSLLFKPKSSRFRPEFVLVQNIAYGSISNQASHSGLVLQAPEKGLFETGLLINNLYRANMRFFYLGFGVGYFQRYGYYALPDKSKNGAFKFGFTVSF